MQSVPETLYHEAKQLIKGELPSPRAAYFTPTYNCDQACYYCFYKEWLNKGTIEDVTKVTNIFEQLKAVGVQSIEFTGGGEPLLAKGIVDMFKLAHNMGFKLGLLTNGVHFNGEIAETFLKLGHYVRISLDTVDSEKYKRIRGTDHLSIVIQNLRDAVQTKRNTKSQCEISVKLGVSTEIDLEDIFESYKKLENIGLNNIQIKNLSDKSGQHYRTDVNRNELLNIRDKNMPMVKKVVYPKYMDEPCFLTPVQTTVDIFGDVYTCPYYMYNKERKIGNLFETPLVLMWGSDAHHEKIEGLRINDCLKHDCRFQKYSRIVRKLQRTGGWDFL